MPAPELLEQVDALGARPIEVVVFRHVSPSIDPRSGTGARIHGGRWNPPGSFATLYFGLDQETVVEEFYRLAQKQGLRVSDFIPRNLCRFHVELHSILDLSSAEPRHAIGLTDSLVRHDDPSFCQAVGEAAHYLGLEGVLAPSAAGPGAILAAFLGRLKPGSSIDLVQVTRWGDAPDLPSRSGHA